MDERQAILHVRAGQSEAFGELIRQYQAGAAASGVKYTGAQRVFPNAAAGVEASPERPR